MNAQRTSSVASHFFSTLVSSLTRVIGSPRRMPLPWLAVALLAALVPLASQAGLRPASVGGSGAVLALTAQLRAAHGQAASGFSKAHGLQRTPDGRTLLPHQMMHSGAILQSRVAASTVVPISEAVQTYDVLNPSPAFRPLIGYGSPTALSNDSSNPPVYINTLAPTNLTPVWSADETFLVFSSNRTATGGIQPDGSFHIWAISVSGGEAFQVTTSTIGTGANPALPHGEFFPALSVNNNTLVFTSDAQSPNTQNLYTVGFSSVALTAGAAPVNVSNSAVISSLTLRAATETASAALTGFSSVQHPTFGTSDGQLIVFSALSTSGTYAGHAHLYFLYQSSGGFSNSNQTSYPGKLTDGPAEDTDPTFSPDGQFIAFSTTATTISNNPNNAFGPTPPSAVQDPDQSQSLTAGPVANRSLFLISGGGSGNGIPFGTVPSAGGLSGGRVTRTGTDNYGPAWSTFANQNQFTNPAPGYAYLAFARASAPTANHDIYYLQVGQGVSSPSSETLIRESGGNAAVHLNTDDTGNAYDDVYPSWSPFLSIFSITYSSNRTVTYNNPANSQPAEVAASVAPGGTVTNPQDSTANYTVGTGYAGLLISQVLNLDPPTLLRFSANEVVHVQAAGANPVTGTPNKLAASGGHAVTLTVRLSDREAGIDDTGGPNGGPRVYIQIKDPDSKYQDAQRLEHKVFMKDRRYDTSAQSNRPANDVTSGTANALLDDYDFTLPGSDLYSSLYNISGGFINLPLYQRYIYPSYGAAGSFPPQVGQDSVSYVNPRGTHGGQWPVDAANNPNNTYLFVGKSAVGTTNPYGSFTYPATPGPGRITQHYPGTDPNQFIPHGPEYEAQVINPLFSAGGTGDAAPTDYSTPYYLAGVDDQGAFSGGTYSTITAKDRPDTEWLPLARVPDNQQDHNGGVLYTVTWTTPTTDSDFYVDVAAFDKSAFPNISGFVYSGQKTNWRIYDNVSGFSTNQNIGNEDILVVSDYALGQKFAATTFGGRNFALNLVPKLFGTESYITDVDVNILPDSVYAGIPSAEAKAAAGTGTPPTPARVAFQFAPVVQPFGRETPGVGDYPGGIYIPTQNGLGAQSFIDPIINDGTVNTDGVPNVQSQRYSIWRILSRGPVPASVLNGYLPKHILQPAIPELNLPAATVLDASRCVIWLSPYTGDVVADPGTIDDPGSNGQVGVTSPRLSTTSVLTNFVQAGGRLFVTGQDVGSTLTLSGTVNNTPSTTPGSPNFLPDVLNATLASTGTSVHLLSGSSDAGIRPVVPTAYTGNRISGDPFYDNTNRGSSFLTLGSPLGAASYLTLSGPIQGQYSINYPNYPWLDNLVIGDADYGDSSLSQMPAAKLPIGPATATSTNVQGQSDVIAATNGAQVALSYVIPITATPFLQNVGAAMVFHDDPYNPAGTGQLPNGGTGSRVVYAAFGLEALTQDYYASASPNSAATISDPPNPLPYNQIIPVVIPRNTRSAILHNIVSYLRTGRVTGTVNTDDGSSADNATVYLSPTGGAPSTRAAFSASTGSGNNGRFTIFGVEPGTYTLVAFKAGYRRAVSNSGVTFTVEGDVTQTAAALTLTHLPPANIAGVVKDTSNAPIDGATVTFTSQDQSVTRSVTTVNGSVVTNSADNYFLQGVPVTAYTATATGPVIVRAANDSGTDEYTPVTAPDAPNAAGVTTTPNTTLDGVNFTLTPIPAVIHGTITSGGVAVPGATVSLTDSNGTAVGTPTTTAADGTYTLANIPATAFPTATTDTITVTAPGFSSGTLSATVYLGSILNGEDVSLVSIPPGSLQVTVTFAAPVGGPVANAVVTYTPPGGTAQTATTGADGTVTIPNLAATTPGTFYTVSAIGPNNTTRGVPTTTAAPAQQITIASGQAATASFEVTRISPSFSGTVTNAAGGTPLANATVTVTDSNGAAIVTVRSGTDGTYTTGPLDPGTYTVTASLAGFAPSATAATPVQYGDALTGVNFALAAVPPGSITGTVKDNNGLPVNLAVVTFNSADGTVTNRTATTNASGVYVIPPAPATADVPASVYIGNAVGPNNDTGTPEYGTDPSAPKTITVPPSGSATANFTLPIIPASITGTVTDAQTSGAVPGATVILTGPDGSAIGAPVTTGANGSYSFTGIVATQTPANYTVTASKTGFASGAVVVPLVLGDHKTQPIVLNEQATLYGLVTDGSPNATGQALSGVTLTVTDSTGTIITTIPASVSTQSGTVSGPDAQPENYLALLLPGTYTVTATKASYDSQSKPVTLTNTAPVRVNFALRSSIGDVGGLITEPDGTTPVANATVTITQNGATAATYTTNGTATTGPDGKPINYSGRLTKGTYTFVVTKGARQSTTATATIVGGAFNRVDFTAAPNGPLPALYTFPAGIQFVSTPYDYSSLGFDGLFGTLNTAPTGTTPNGNRSHVAVWNPLAGAYALDPTAPADSLRLGVGYWVYLKAAVPVLQQGTTPSAGYVAVTLNPGWNQIGVPNPVKDSTGQYVGIAVSRLMFDNGSGGKITYAQAGTAQYSVVDPNTPLYQYAGAGSYQSVGTTGTLKPWLGYWLYVKVPATLEIPTN